MKKSAILIGTMLTVATQAALAQAPPPPPTSTTARPLAARYGGISGSWLMPSGDFEKIANDGWAITLEGYQFVTPTRKLAVGTQIGYQSFGEKNGVSVSNFPVDALLKFFPKPGMGKADFYLTGGLGFNYHRTEVLHSTSYDYYFGTQAGAGVELHTGGPVSLAVDAVYHWIFASGTDTNFIALRGGLVIPLTR